MEETSLLGFSSPPLKASSKECSCLSLYIHEWIGDICPFSRVELKDDVFKMTSRRPIPGASFLRENRKSVPVRKIPCSDGALPIVGIGQRSTGAVRTFLSRQTLIDQQYGIYDDSGFSFSENHPATSVLRKFLYRHVELAAKLLIPGRLPIVGKAREVEV